MAVPEQTPYSEHTGNGVTKSFALNFDCESKDHLIVLVDEIEPPIATWSLSDGNVVFTTAPAAGKKITLQRNTPFGRTTNYQSFNNSFRPQTVNIDFDRIWWKLQELGVADWILSNRISALKNYVDRKDDELKAYLMEEIRKQGVALDQLDDYYSYLMERLAQIAVDKGWDASFVVDGNENQHDINNRTTRQIATISELKNHTPRKNGQIIEVINYDSNVFGIYNKYIYQFSSSLDDNYGTVISSSVVDGRWLMLPKDEYYPRDFGVQAEVASAENDNRLSAYITSGLNLVLPALSEYEFTTIKSFEVNKPLFLRGSGMYSSIIKRISLYFETSDSRVTDVGLHTLVPQYTCYIRRGNRNVFTRVHAYHSYDGFAIYRNHAAPETEQLEGNQFIDCVSEKAGRVAFTVDIGAYRTLLKRCKAVDSRQGFHVEGAETTWIKNALTDGCGLGAAFDTGENVGYEGSLRSYGVKGLFVEGFKNINPNGRCQWQHGAASIGSSDLVFEDMNGLGDLILDNENGITQNFTVRDVPDFGIYNQNVWQLISGKILLENIDDGSICQIGATAADSIILRNTKLKTTGIGSSAPDSVMILDNTTFKHNRVCTLGAAHINIVNGIKNIQDGQADPAFFQGLRFDCALLKTFFADHIEITGTATGTHLSFYNASNQIQSGYIGKLFSDISYTIGYNAYVAAGLEAFALLGIDYDSRKIVRADAIPNYGKWRVGDMILKLSVGADTIYGWICTNAGDGTAAVWKPLKHDI